MSCSQSDLSGFLSHRKAAMLRQRWFEVHLPNERASGVTGWAVADLPICHLLVCGRTEKLSTEFRSGTPGGLAL